MRTPAAIIADLLREREKLCSMRLGESGTLEQSRVVDALIVEYCRVGRVTSWPCLGWHTIVIRA